MIIESKVYFLLPVFKIFILAHIFFSLASELLKNTSQTEICNILRMSYATRINNNGSARAKKMQGMAAL
jgi:hypothetical protein